MSPDFEKVSQGLTRLKLPHLRVHLDDHLRLAQAKTLTYLEFLTGLIQEELNGREQANYQRRLKCAKLPIQKTLEGFDFDFQPSLAKGPLKQLKDCRWVANAENLIFAGQSGTGKTHLAIALTMAAIENGYKAYFTTVADLLDQVKVGRLTGRLGQLEAKLLKQDVIVLDELGYLKINQDQGNFLFRLISKAYERMALVITTNKDFSGWAAIFEDQVQVTAMLDRLLHHCHLFKIKGESYRIKGRQEVDCGD